MKKIEGLRRNLLFKNTIWMFMGNGSRVIIQAFYFVMIARILGVTGYGAFVGIAALAAIAAPFSSLGTGNLLIKNVARDSRLFQHCWGNAIAMTAVSGLFLSCLVIGASRYVLPASIPFLFIISVVLSDMVFARMLDICCQAFQAHQKMGWTANLQVLFSSSRLCAAMLLILIPHSTTIHWGYLYLASTAVSACIGYVIVHTKLGSPRFNSFKLKNDLKEGFYFSFSLSAQSIYNDIDKSMLAKLSTLEASGIFGAATRIIDVAFTPVRSLLAAAYAKFFQRGALSGITGSLSLAKKLLPPACIYALISGAVLYLTAPYIRYILGSDFRNAVDAIQWLALLPLLRTLHYFAADTLTGADYQGTRTGVQILIALINGAMNLLLIPHYSWMGAAWASLTSNSLLAIILWGYIWYKYKGEQTKFSKLLSKDKLYEP